MTSTPPSRSRSFTYLLAYGNSDQASFRDPRVRECFDIMSVPGTIASYYDEATAAFVLSSKVQYLIDPRTPLFQDVLEAPRASHYSLAEWHGTSVLDRMGPPKAAEARFPASFYNDAVVAEMVREAVTRQRGYAGNAPRVTKKLDRYAKLLALAMQEQHAPTPTATIGPPSYVLTPYFAVRGEGDPWWQIMLKVWSAASRLDEPDSISPVLCVGTRAESTPTGSRAVGGASVLAELLTKLPTALSKTCFFWVTGFDERAVDVSALRELWSAVRHRPQGLRLINLYGGFFSICLQHAGLAGFGNGLTYSESRDWPALAATGSAPPRYYLRDLHMFAPPAQAAYVVARVPAFECDCSACDDVRSRGGTIASMTYHELKRHFAIARRWEQEIASKLALAEIAQRLREAERAVAAVRGGFPRGTLGSTGHLGRWATVLENPPA